MEGMCHLASTSQKDEINQSSVIVTDKYTILDMSTTHQQTGSAPEWAPSLGEALRPLLGCPLSARGGWVRDTFSRNRKMTFSSFSSCKMPQTRSD